MKGIEWTCRTSGLPSGPLWDPKIASDMTYRMRKCADSNEGGLRIQHQTGVSHEIPIF